MKKSFFFLMILTPLSILAQKVDFTDNLSKAKKQAAKEQKLIFIDFYTDWCKPCKMLDAEAFSEGEIADRLNAFFVNVKIDAESDRSTASKYEINSYPTSLIVDSTGKVIHRSSGYGGVKPFWNKLEPALATTEKGAVFIILKAEFEKGRRDADFLKNYTRFRNIVGLKNDAIVDELIEKMPVDSQNVYTAVLIQAIKNIEGKGFNYLIEHKSEKRFLQKLKALIQLNYQEALVAKDKKKLPKILAANKLVYDTPSVSAAENAVLESGFYWQIKNEDKFNETVLNYLAHIPTDTIVFLFTQKTIDFSDFYFNNIKNKKPLNALEMQLSNINKSIKNVDLMTAQAKILYRLEQFDKAISLVEKAKELSTEKADFSTILQKIKERNW